MIITDYALARPRYTPLFVCLLYAAVLVGVKATALHTVL